MLILIAAIFVITSVFSIIAQLFCSNRIETEQIIAERNCNFDFRRATRPTHSLLRA